MTLPSFVYGMLIATLYGAAFHLWKGGNLGRIILYILFSWVGFWIGHFIGDSLGITFASLGPLRLATATIGSIGMLFLGQWLSMIRPANTK